MVDLSYPTPPQTLTCFIRCQVTTCTFLLPIHIVRLDERDGSIYILAGNDLGIKISRDGEWRFEE